MQTHYVLNTSASCTHVWAVDPPGAGFLQNLRAACEAYNESGALDGTFIVCDSVRDLVSHVSEIFPDFSGESLGDVADYLAGEGDVYYAEPADLLDFVQDFTRSEDGKLPDPDPKYELDILRRPRSEHCSDRRNSMGSDNPDGILHSVQSSGHDWCIVQKSSGYAWQCSKCGSEVYSLARPTRSRLFNYHGDLLHCEEISVLEIQRT